MRSATASNPRSTSARRPRRSSSSASTIGLDTQAEPKQAEARVSQARADIEATDEAIALTKNALAALVGAGPDRALSIGRPAVARFRRRAFPPTLPSTWSAAARTSPRSRSRVEAAAQRIKEARAAFYPNVNLSALIGLQSFGLGNLFSGGSGFGSVGPAISLPIFHGGALQGQYRGRRGQYDEAVALTTPPVIQALRETADAVTSQKMLVSRLAESRSALADFRRGPPARPAALRAGARDLSRRADRRGGRRPAPASPVAQLETRAFTLDVQLVRALGGGFAAA